MRPHHLEIQAFGPFAKSESINFDDLADVGLFLIHGPTGAGKTTILDALCFALYGRLPGDRDAKYARSDHADAGAEPRVVFEFSTQGGRYRVERTAGWDAPKKNGTGRTFRPATASLRRIDAGAMGVLELARSGPTEVNSEITDLLGLNCEQFQQVIMLPQGRFKKLLRASSSERELLFESLFGTGLFKAAQDWLKQQAAIRKSRSDELHGDLSREGREILVRSQEVLGEPVEGDELDPAVIAAAVKAVDARVQELVLAHATAEEAEKEAGLKLTELNSVAVGVANRDDLRARLAQLDQAQAAIEAAGIRLELATEANELKGVFDQHDQRSRDLESREQAATTDLTLTAQAVSSLQIPVAEVSELNLASPPDRRPLRQAIEALVDHQHHLEKLNDLATQVAADETALDQANNEQEKAQKQAELAGVAVESAQAEIDEVEELLGLARMAQGTRAHLEEAATAAQDRAAAAQELAEKEPQLAKAGVALEAAKSKLNDRREAHLDARERFIDGVASMLAAELSPGDPCQVCGSLEHPRLAKAASDAVSREQVDALEAEVTRAQANVEEIAEERNELKSRVAVLRQSVGQDDLNVVTAVAQAKAAQEHLLRVNEQVAQIDGYRASMEKAETAKKHAQANADQANQDAVAASTSAAAILERLTRNRATLAQQMPSGVTAQAELDRVAALKECFERITGHADDINDAITARDVAKEALEKAIEESSFRSPQDAKAAMLDAQQCHALAHKISEHQKLGTELRGRLAAPELEKLPDLAPDIDAPRAAHLAAQEELNQVISTLATARSAQEVVGERAQRHEALVAALATARQETELYRAVSDRCNGTSGRRITLQRWVLAAYLADACRYANRRLAVMTSGRYQLEVDSTSAKGNGSAGLEIKVHDQHTNQSRVVSTLSGGETFQASLALALGVADSVSAHAGGVHIDALFIDEGFGTLDPDSLDLAMDELDRLREGGRMVGVISHVAGLKERINYGIEVNRVDQGSSIKVGAVG